MTQQRDPRNPNWNTVDSSLTPSIGQRQQQQSKKQTSQKTTTGTTSSSKNKSGTSTQNRKAPQNQGKR